MLRFLELPSRVIFDANAGKISLLEVIEEKGLTQEVVGFYEGLADLRSVIAAAKLQKRMVTAEELSGIEEKIQSRGKFALALSDRLLNFFQLSEPPG